MLALPYLAYITIDLNPADWAASVAQLAEHWTSNPVVTGSNPVRGSFFHVCLRTLPYLLSLVFICIYTYSVPLCIASPSGLVICITCDVHQNAWCCLHVNDSRTSPNFMVEKS